MDAIGIQRLRDGLSRYLEDVSQGKTFTITRHNRPIAVLVPIRPASTLQRLVAEGKVRPPVRRKARHGFPPGSNA
jgi:prevent-host-death family protein